MIHYSCDFCGNDIPREEARFEVRIEVRLAFDDEIAFPPELLEEGAWDLLDGIESEGLAASDGSVELRVFRFDLCPACQAAFLNDPLARSRRVGLRHLEN